MDERGEKAQSSGKRSTMCRTRAIIQRTLWKYSRKIRLTKKEKKGLKYNDSTIKRGRYRLSETMLPGVARPVYGVLLRTSPLRLTLIEPDVPGKSRSRKFNRRSPLTDILESRKETGQIQAFSPPLKMTCSLAKPCRCTSSAVPPGMHADEFDREPPRGDILSLTANCKWENSTMRQEDPILCKEPNLCNFLNVIAG